MTYILRSLNYYVGPFAASKNNQQGQKGHEQGVGINKCLEFYILLVNSKKFRTSQKVLKYTKNNVRFCSWYR
jgi:hypothetical protein